MFLFTNDNKRLHWTQHCNPTPHQTSPRTNLQLMMHMSCWQLCCAIKQGMVQTTPSTMAEVHEALVANLGAIGTTFPSLGALWQGHTAIRADASNTAQQHGQPVATATTSSCLGEQLLSKGLSKWAGVEGDGLVLIDTNLATSRSDRGPATLLGSDEATRVCFGGSRAAQPRLHLKTRMAPTEVANTIVPRDKLQHPTHQLLNNLL
jgi:hypothetical protein